MTIGWLFRGHPWAAFRGRRHWVWVGPCLLPDGELEEFRLSIRPHPCSVVIGKPGEWLVSHVAGQQVSPSVGSAICTFGLHCKGLPRARPHRVLTCL